MGIAFAAALLLLFSTEAAEAALSAATVFARGVMPSLFPMMALCGLIREKKSKSSGYASGGAIVFAFAAGAPASMRRLRALSDAGRVRVGAPLLAACGVMSPMFFIGTLAGWMGHAETAWHMLAVHWLSALAVGGACRVCERLFKRSANVSPAGDTCEQTPSRNGSIFEALPEALISAARALLVVLGAMMLFSIVTGVLRALLFRLAPDWAGENVLLLDVLWAALEIGGGSHALISNSAHAPLGLLCAMCGFGGLSVLIQNMMYLKGIINPVKLLGLKALHGVVSYGFFHLLLCCVPGLALDAMGGVSRMGTFIGRLGGLDALSTAILLILAACRPSRSLS